MFTTFTRFAVEVGASFATVRPVVVDGIAYGKSTLDPTVMIPLQGTMRVITATKLGTLATATKSGSVHRIAARLVTGKVETLDAMLKRNPWKNPNATRLFDILNSK